MNKCYFCLKLQLISNITHPFQDFLRSYTSTTEFPFLLKYHRPIYRLHLQKNPIINFDQQFPSPYICIGFLATLGSLKLVYYELHFLHSIMNCIRHYEVCFTLLKPTNLISTYTPIHCVTRGTLNAGLVTIIVKEIYKRKVIIPTTLEIHHTNSQHVHKGLNGTLCLPFYLWDEMQCHD